jgi:glycine dehydrogenase
MIVELTGLDFANASLLDESNAAAEAMALSFSVHNNNRKKFFVSKNLFPQSIDVCRTRAKANGIDLVIGDIADFPWSHAKEFCGAIFQNPDNIGNMENYTELFAKFKENGIVSILSQDIMSTVISKPAGEMGADIAVGSAQRFGLPMAFGGPHPGYMACKDEFKRKMPGRIIGVSRDKHGDLAYRMTLQTREQHIRRDKATSNICTAQNLLSNMTALYGIWHGPVGLKKISTRIRFYTQMLYTALQQLGIVVLTDKHNFFDTLVFDVKASGFSSADQVLADFHKYGINLRKLDDNKVGISINETTVILKLATLVEIFALLLEKKDLGNTYLEDDFFTIQKYQDLHKNLKRSTEFMQQPVFNDLHSETEFMRYIHKICDKDYSLVNGMIPLGSCTMKLNSAAVMTPITFPGLCEIHPFAPKDQTEGY